MEYSEEIRNQVINLRKKGKTYQEICSSLKTSILKGTMSGWLHNIKPSPKYYARIKSIYGNNLEKANLSKRSQLEKRLSDIRLKNVSTVDHINTPIAKIVLATLYWCEGNKYPTSQSLKFGNSDPKMIKLFLSLLRACYSMDESKFRLTVQCRSDQNTIELLKFWTEITNIPWTQHYQPRIDKRSIGKPTQKNNYHGVCVVDYFDSNLQCELQFLGEYLGTDKAISQMINQIK